MTKVLSSPRHKACFTHPNGNLLPLVDKSPIFSQLEDLPMGYCHCYTQLKSVPNDHWLLLTVQLSNVFLIIQNRHAPGYKQSLLLCTSDGRHSLLQPADLIVQSGILQPAISFNSEEKEDLEYESFFPGQHSSGSEFCKTSLNWSPDRPYDFMVKATLLLAHRFCICCYDI